MNTSHGARYEEIAAYLRDLIDQAEPGERLPSEAELCQQFGVSRMTARHAVQQVEADGSIERRRGAGTFVRSRQVPRDLGSPLSFSENMRGRGMEPSSRVLLWERIRPSSDERAALELGPDEMAFVLERLRMADDVPMAIERAVVPEELALAIEDRVEDGSLHGLFRQIGRIPTMATAEVTARRATKRERELLALPGSGIVMVERRTIYDHEHAPVERTVTWYAGERYSFNAVLVSDGLADPR